MQSIETFGVVGAGEFGKVVAEHLAPLSAQVLIFDKNPRAELPENAEAADMATVAESDVVVAAVPFDAYPTVIPEIAAHATPDTLIVDVCSVKTKPAEVFADHGLLDRPNVLMTHPLFGPQSIFAGVGGKNVVITQAHGERTEALLDYWRQKGLGTVDMSAEDHDKEMAKVHVLPFIIGRSLLMMDITESPLATGYFGKLLTLIDVERHHSPELFNTIQQHNPYAANMRSELIATMSLLHAQVVVDAVKPKDAAEALDQLQEYRGIIDMLDEYAMILRGLRFGITQQVGQLKAQVNLPSVDPAREELQRKKIEAQAADHGAPTDLSLAIHRLTVEEVARQHDEIKQNKA